MDILETHRQLFLFKPLHRSKTPPKDGGAKSRLNRPRRQGEAVDHSLPPRKANRTIRRRRKAKDTNHVYPGLGSAIFDDRIQTDPVVLMSEDTTVLIAHLQNQIDRRTQPPIRIGSC